MRILLHNRRRHEDGDHQISPRAKFHKGRRDTFRRPGHKDGADDLPRLQGRLAIAGDKIAQRQHAPSRSRGEFHAGIQRQKGRHAISRRRGIAEVPRDGAAVLDLDGAHLTGGCLQRIKGRRQAGTDNVAPCCGGSEAEAVCHLRDATKAFNPRKINNGAVQRLSRMGGKHIGAAGQRQRTG